MMTKGDRVMAFGIIPDVPLVFWDLDCDDPKEGLKKIDKIVKERGLRNELSEGGRPYAIYKTKHGYHFIIRCKSWDEVQDWLYILKEQTGGQSIMNCRKQRIRVTMKFLERNGMELSPAPKLIETNWVSDLRTGKKEIYTTYDYGLNAGASELPP